MQTTLIIMSNGDGFLASEITSVMCGEASPDCYARVIVNGQYLYKYADDDAAIHERDRIVREWRNALEKED